MTDEQATAWTGWITFAGVMMMIGGTLATIQGLVAAVNDDWSGWNVSDDLLLDLSAWGWISVLVGIVVFCAGLGVFTGNVLARTIGVIVASLSLIANFLWLPAFPIWSITVIVIDALVIWALTAHGGEMRLR